MRIIRKQHQHAETTHEITDADAAAIERWEYAGSLTEGQEGYDELTDAQKADADCAVAWKLHDLSYYQICDE